MNCVNITFIFIKTIHLLLGLHSFHTMKNIFNLISNPLTSSSIAPLDKHLCRQDQNKIASLFRDLSHTLYGTASDDINKIYRYCFVSLIEV